MGCHTWFYKRVNTSKAEAEKDLKNLYCISDKGVFKGVKDYHDLFRTEEGTRYSNKILYSLKETLNFIEENKLTITSNNLKRLQTFWTEYPNGCIDFG